tara:strand:+ start:111 stop:338 length:228 start_codon:yes stop_codon:yes gene_type:complete
MPRIRLISDVKKNRQTGTHIQVDFGLCEMETYQATCYTHGYYVNASTLHSIRRIATDPLGWCFGCQEEHEEEDLE